MTGHVSCEMTGERFPKALILQKFTKRLCQITLQNLRCLGNFIYQFRTAINQRDDILKCGPAAQHDCGKGSDALADHIPGTVSASTSGASFVEVTHVAANKGAAVEALCGRLGVEQAATAAFGDHTNDLEMLRWVGRGYVMANAHPRAFDASPLRAPHHAEHGVAQIIAELAGVAFPG